MYVIRNEQGMLIATLPTTGLDKLLTSRIGEWKTKYFESGKVRNCFVIKETGGYISSSSGIVLYLLEGYYFYMKED